MALESVLLRPKLLERSSASEELRVLNNLLELASRLGQDALTGKVLVSKLEAILQSSVEELLNELRGRFEASGEKLRAWFQPFVDAVKEKAELADEPENGGQVVASLGGVLGLLTAALDNLTSDELAAKLNELGDIVEDDMGLSRARLAALINQVVDRAVAELTAPYLGGDDTEDAKRSFLVGTQLQSIRAYFSSLPVVFEFDRRALVAQLAAELKLRKWDEYVGKISEVTSKVGQAAGGVSPLFSLRASASVSANPPPDPMSWYASWFFGGVTMVDDRFNFQNGTLPPEREGGPRVPINSQITFDSLSPRFLEHWAHVTSGATDLVEALFHGLSIERGDRASNIVNMLLQAAKGVFTLAVYGHEGEDWKKAFELTEHAAYEYLIAFGLNLFTSLEGIQTGGADRHRFLYYLTLLGADVVEVFLYASWTILARESSLSLFTLINAQPDAVATSKNHEKFDGFVFAFTELSAWLMALAPGRQRFGFGGGAGAFFGFWVLGLVAGWVSGIVGWAIAGAISGKHTDFGSMTWKTLLLTLVKWPIYWYIVWNGNTKGGKLVQDMAGNVVPFRGYPGRADSPYRLPYKKGESVQCAQGHNGVWSHNFPSQQVYAVDYGFDHGSEVLASRGGTVVDFRDSIPDHSTETHNFIKIAHDDESEGVLPNPEHDRDQTGVVYTHGEYLHGAHLGVRHVFALLGIPKDSIIGTKVKRGQLIMFSGDTGMSAYNHLHVQVGTTNCDSIPFVYREVRNTFGRDGVPKALNNYVSDNDEVVAPVLPSLYQPAYQASTAGNKTRGAGHDHVILDGHASDEDDAYKDRFIYVWFDNGLTQTNHEYKKILRYEGDTRKATVEGDWKSPPAANSDYIIGAPPYDRAGDFNKRFGYYAPFEEVGGVAQARNFADGREPYKYVAVAAYHPPTLSGEVQMGGAAGGDSLTLEAAASTTDDEYKGRFIIIKRNIEVIQYKKITGYVGFTKRVTIEGTWDVAVRGAPGGDRYVIGAAPYDRATDEDKRYAYLCPDSNVNANTPVNFPGGKQPYTYATFRP